MLRHSIGSSWDWNRASQELAIIEERHFSIQSEQANDLSRKATRKYRRTPCAAKDCAGTTLQPEAEQRRLFGSYGEIKDETVLLDLINHGRGKPMFSLSRKADRY